MTKPEQVEVSIDVETSPAHSNDNRSTVASGKHAGATGARSKSSSGMTKPDMG